MVSHNDLLTMTPGFSKTKFPPSVSVLMAVHNGEAYLREAVDSLLAQTFPDFELVIVDDGSTDQTPALLDRFAMQDDRLIRLRNDKNLGLAGALNRGLTACRAPLVARADADDVYMPDRLAKQVAFMRANPGVGVLGTAVEFIDENGGPRKDRLDNFFTSSEDLRFQTRLGCSLWHTVVMFRAGLVRGVGGYDEGFSRGPEDYDLWARLLDKTRFANLPDVLSKVRLHGASSTANWDSGFKLYCSISQRLLSQYLGRAVSTEEAADAVTLIGWSSLMPVENIMRANNLVRELRACASNKETESTYRRFKRRCVKALLGQAEITVYADPRASRNLLVEALRWSPLTFLHVRTFMMGIRLAIPQPLRDWAKQVGK